MTTRLTLGTPLTRRRLTLFPALLLLALANAASAQDNSGSAEISGATSQGIDQVVYKGLVGSMLDAIPMDSAQRVDLQRTNAVVSNTLLGRSLAILAGLSNPALMLGGFVWGMWAASNIKPAEAGVTLSADSIPSERGAAAQERPTARLADSTAANSARGESVSEPVLVSSLSAADTGGAAYPRPQVIKIWLPQRSPAPPQ